VRMLTTRAGSRTRRYYNVYGVNQETPHGLEFEEVSSWGELQTAKYTIKMLDGDGASTWPSEGYSVDGRLVPLVRKEGRDVSS